MPEAVEPYLLRSPVQVHISVLLLTGMLPRSLHFRGSLARHGLINEPEDLWLIKLCLMYCRSVKYQHFGPIRHA